MCAALCTLLGITAVQGSLSDGPLHLEVGSTGEAGGVLGRRPVLT